VTHDEAAAKCLSALQASLSTAMAYLVPIYTQLLYAGCTSFTHHHSRTPQVVKLQTKAGAHTFIGFVYYTKTNKSLVLLCLLAAV
jgi:hypothetical protein